MRIRLLAALVGGAVGLAVAMAFPVGAGLGLTPALANIACTFAGLAVGYLATVLLDVFQTPSE